MDRLLKEIDTLKEEVEELKIQKKSIRNLDKDFQIKYIYNSNAIEGNTLTLHETKVVLEGITIGGKTLREHFEVINHAEAILYIENMVKNKEELSEYALHQSILENIEYFLKELGIGFLYAGSEIKIKIGDRYNYIDFLLFNVKFNCYVVIELKVTEFKAEYIGQITKYINYIDKNIKESFHDRTVGVIICKKENKFVMEYCTDNRIFTTTYLTV